MNLTHKHKPAHELFRLNPSAQTPAFVNAPAGSSLSISATQPTNSSLPNKLNHSKKRAEYRIVDGANGVAELELRVNDMLDQGWKLVGGLCFNQGCSYQAMARITAEPLEPTAPRPAFEANQ